MSALYLTSVQDDPVPGETILRSLTSLERYVRAAGYEGHDPYDAMNSPLLRSLPGTLLKVAATQALVYSPSDLRRPLLVPRGRNPKATALFLSSYCDLRKASLIAEGEFNSTAAALVDSLLADRSAGYSGACWGFNFDWQDITRYAEKGTPTIVVTSFAANALLDLYELTGEPRCLTIARSACDFVLNDLNVTETSGGICFSYTPIDRQVVHNANLMGAALLARVYAHTGEETLLDRSRSAVSFSVGEQEEDGSWAYSLNLSTGRKRYQIDFHQGFIITSLLDVVRYTGLDDGVSGSILRGAEFYRREQFDAEGRAAWRLPRRWPTDIHSQAQGIITFTELEIKEGQYLDLGLRIAQWTCQNMQHRDGHFFYHRYPLGTIETPYMRWGQAWMMRALSLLARRLAEGNGD